MLVADNIQIVNPEGELGFCQAGHLSAPRQSLHPRCFLKSCATASANAGSASSDPPGRKAWRIESPGLDDDLDGELFAQGERSLTHGLEVRAQYVYECLLPVMGSESLGWKQCFFLVWRELLDFQNKMHHLILAGMTDVADHCVAPALVCGAGWHRTPACAGHQWLDNLLLNNLVC